MNSVPSGRKGATQPMFTPKTKRSTSRRILLAASVLPLCLILALSPAWGSNPTGTVEGDSMLNLAKKIIRKAGEVGLDAAGQVICGPAWPFMKKILSPVVEELEKRYPNLLLSPQKADQAAEALSRDTALQKMLQDNFAKLSQGQAEIMAALARNDTTLQQISQAVNVGFRDTDKKLDDVLAVMQHQLAQINLKLSGLSPPTVAPGNTGLSIRAISTQASAYQWDAMRYVEAGNADIATQRLQQARGLLAEGLQRYPQNPDLLVILGYVAKTEAQVAQLRGDQDGYVAAFNEAARSFGDVLTRDPRNVGALNGLANVYLFNREYDSAIELSSLAVASRPDYGAAHWDLAIALEEKIKTTGTQPALLKQLKATYQRLLELMPQSPEAFSAGDLNHVQQRLQALGAKKTPRD